MATVEPSTKFGAYRFIQCTQCGGPIGITETDNLVNRLAKLEEKLDKCIPDMQAKLLTIEDGLRRILE
jgi:hypothetical protein